MAQMTLVIGNRNYSSWSLRPWLAMRMAGLDFTEIVIPLDQADTATRIAEHSGAGRVPVLHHAGLTVWESLAICEYVAETTPEACLWPSDRAARAAARAVSAEMHAGFAALREALPMNVRADRPGVPLGPSVKADIRRIEAIWSDCRGRFGAGGPFLFGQFSIADAMFAPVASRFRTYHVDLDPSAQAYCDLMLGLPSMADWAAAAAAEPWTIEAEEVGRP